MSFTKIKPSVLTSILSVPRESDLVTAEMTETEEILENGKKVVRSSLQKVKLSDVNKRISVIDPKDYTLENLIEAGVDLQRVNTAGLIGSNDKAVIDDLQSASVGDVFEQLQDVVAEQEYDAKVAAAKNAAKNNVTEKTDE